MKLDPLSSSSSYCPTGTSAAFNLYAQNFFSTVTNTSYQVTWPSNLLPIQWIVGGGPVTTSQAGVCIEPLWDYFFYTYRADKSQNFLWEDIYNSNPSYYNELFGSFFREFMRYGLENGKITNMTLLGSVDDTSGTSWMSMWKLFLGQTGNQDPNATPQTRGPYGVETMVPNKLNYGWQGDDVRSNALMWSIRTIRAMMQAIQNYLSVYNQMVQIQKNMIQSSLQLSIQMTGLQSATLTNIQANSSNDPVKLQEQINIAQTQNQKRTIVINTQQTAIQKQQQALTSNSTAISNAATTINKFHDTVQKTLLAAFKTTSFS